MHHCGRGSGCSQHYLNYDAKVYNLSLPINNGIGAPLLLSAVSEQNATGQSATGQNVTRQNATVAFKQAPLPRTWPLLRVTVMNFVPVGQTIWT